MTFKVLYVGIEAELRINVKRLEDACYSIFELYSKKNAIVSIDKTACSRIIVYGSDYEVRLFVHRTNGNAILSISVGFSGSGRWDSHRVASYATTIFGETFSTISRFSEELRRIRIYVKSSLRLPTHRIRGLIDELRQLGIALTKLELRDLEESSIYVMSGLYVEPGLKTYEISILALIRNEPIAEASATISTSSTLNCLLHDLVSLMGTTWAFLELVANNVREGSDP